MECTLTDNQLKKLKYEISDALSKIRHQLLIPSPFIGSVAMRLNLIPVRDVRCRTACTDTRNIYFDIDFFSKLTTKEAIFVLAHEVWHCALLHFARCQNRDHRLFNIATDMEVNHMLKSDLNGIANIPSGLVFPPSSLEGKSAEVIYDWLEKRKNFDEAAANADMHDHKLAGQFDKHVYSDKLDNNDEHSSVIDQWGTVGFDSDFQPGIPKDAAENMRSAVVNAAHQYSREHGSLPAYIAGLVDKFAKPQVNWRERLCQFVSKHYGSSCNWCPPNRRYLHGDMYFQSRRAEDIKIGIFIDTSGSTSADLPQFFGELKGLVESFSGYVIHCIHCDADINKYEIYDNLNPLVLTAGNIEVHGGGGTDLTPPFKYIDDNNIELDCAIYMTDGYADAPNVDPPPYPVMWLITKNGSDAAFKAFGEIVWFKDAQF